VLMLLSIKESERYIFTSCGDPVNLSILEVRTHDYRGMSKVQLHAKH